MPMEKVKLNLTTEFVVCLPADADTDYMLLVIAATCADVHTTHSVAPTDTNNDLLLRLIDIQHKVYASLK